MDIPFGGRCWCSGQPSMYGKKIVPVNRDQIRSYPEVMPAQLIWEDESVPNASNETEEGGEENPKTKSERRHPTESRQSLCVMQEK